MKRPRSATVSALLTAALLAAAPAAADVVRIDVETRAEVAGGVAYGLAGPYESLAGVVHFEVDPANPANRIVSDIELAPRNERGMVEFRSNFFLLKPKDAGRGNGTVLYEVSNRGGKGMLGYFNNARRQPRPANGGGDGRRLPAGERILAAVARLAVRRAGARRADAAAHAGGDGRRGPDHGASCEAR